MLMLSKPLVVDGQTAVRHRTTDRAQGTGTLVPSHGLMECLVDIQVRQKLCVARQTDIFILIL